MPRVSCAPVAIVSANAFDRGLDNDVGVAPADFVLKPVRKAELLDWLGRAMALEWLHAPLPETVAPAGASGAISPFVYPSDERLRSFDDLVSLGYFRGIVNLLDAIEAETPECAGFVTHLRGLARRFELDAMTGVLRKARDERLME